MLLASLTDAAVAGNDLWSKAKKILALGNGRRGELARRSCFKFSAGKQFSFPRTVIPPLTSQSFAERD